MAGSLVFLFPIWLIATIVLLLGSRRDSASVLISRGTLSTASGARAGSQR